MTTPKTILITGAGGALGRYASLYYRHHRQFTVVPLDRAAFNDPAQLGAAVAGADLVLHLAGVNRAPDDELGPANPAIARRLVEALAAAGSTATLLYASSLHEAAPGVYGRSKREAGDILEAWAAQAGARFVRFLLPHIYCELTRPNYNSGIATFAHALATGATPELKVDAEIFPLHALDLCALFDAAIDGDVSGPQSPLGAPWRMSDILGTVTDMHRAYRDDLIVPDLREPRRLNLFNTYRQHLYPAGFPVSPKLHADERGNLFEAVKELNGGQAFISRTRPGITRGNHFHFRKVERFCVLEGEALIRMRPADRADTVTYSVSGARPCFIDMPTLWTHNITNTGPGELLTLFWSHELFDPAAPDTYALPV